MEVSSDDADLKKKEWRKKQREFKKELKKQEKEEEHKRNLMSKDSKVVIIDKKTFESISKKNEKRKSEATSGPINFNEFPALKVAPEKKEVEDGNERRRTSKLTRSSWSRLPIAEALKNDNSIDTFPSLESTFNRRKRKAAEAVGAPVQSLEIADFPEPEVAKPNEKLTKPTSLPEKEQPGKKSKKKKHKDPVVLNLNEILIAKSAKKDKKNQVLGSKYRKRKEREFLSGNILDSANPERKKGKHWEKTKKRLSHLKLAIIKDRIIKAKIKEKAIELAFKNSDVDLNKEIDFKTEVEKYLERLEVLKSNLKKKTGKKEDLSSDTSKISIQVSQTNNTSKVCPAFLQSSGTVKKGPSDFSSKTEEYLQCTATSKISIPISQSNNTKRKKSFNFTIEKDKSLQSNRTSTFSVPVFEPNDTAIENPSDLVSKKAENFPTSAPSTEKPLHSNNTMKLQRFSSKFRDYCENALTPSLDAAVKELINEIVYLQDRMFARDQIKARARKRHVIGFREAKKYLSLKKVKMLIIAPDLEKSESKDSISDLVNGLKESSAAQNVPCVFALDRRKLGYTSKKKVPVSVFAVLNYEGTEAKFASVLESFAEAKDLFDRSPLASKKEEKINEGQASIVDDVTSQLASTFISVLSEKRNDSDVHDDDEEEINPFLRFLSRSDKN